LGADWAGEKGPRVQGVKCLFLVLLLRAGNVVAVGDVAPTSRTVQAVSLIDPQPKGDYYVQYGVIIILLDITLWSYYYAYYYSELEVDVMDAKDYISATALSKNTSASLASLEKGEAEKLIVLKNNAPKAILLSIDAYQAMEEEIEDLRLTALALARLQSFEPEDAIPHKDLMDKYS
jgi:antitoxin StbD